VGYRLSSDSQADLSWYWCSAEADIGQKSNAGATIERARVLAASNVGAGPIPAEPPSGIRLALAASNFESRRAAQDARLRMYWLLGPPAQDRGQLVDPMPDRAEKHRVRLLKVDRTVRRLIRMPRGAWHQLILYRVYGPVTRHPLMYGKLGTELSNLVEYTPTVCARIRAGVPPQQAGEAVLHKDVSLRAVTDVRLEAEALLVAASRAYEVAEAAERDDRTAARSARFRAILGAA
jgi:hypothetical protein